MNETTKAFIFQTKDDATIFKNAITELNKEAHGGNYRIRKIAIRKLQGWNLYACFILPWAFTDYIELKGLYSEYKQPAYYKDVAIKNYPF
jgi:hypothetical protein